MQDDVITKSLRIFDSGSGLWCARGQGVQEPLQRRASSAQPASRRRTSTAQPPTPRRRSSVRVRWESNRWCFVQLSRATRLETLLRCASSSLVSTFVVVSVNKHENVKCTLQSILNTKLYDCDGRSKTIGKTVFKHNFKIQKLTDEIGKMNGAISECLHARC